jgi:hypothetical protein
VVWILFFLQAEWGLNLPLVDHRVVRITPAAQKFIIPFCSSSRSRSTSWRCWPGA